VRALARASLVLTILVAPVSSQTAPLAADKQAIVREHIRRAKVPEAKLNAPAIVGMAIPDDVELWGLPQDSGTEVPTLTSYKFF
jgi:hypothetical protein